MTETTQQALRRQAQQAALDRAALLQKKQAQQPAAPIHAAAANAVVPATRARQALPTMPDTRDNVERYLDEAAPSGLGITRIKFTRDGKFIRSDTEEEIGAGIDFIAHCDQVLVGHRKFTGSGQPPSLIVGLLFDGFVVTLTDELPDRDQAAWPIGLSGLPEDPWQLVNYLPVQNCDSKEVLSFVTSSRTGRNGVGDLLRHYRRMCTTHPGELPVVRLKTGGFPRKQGGTWVNKPVFVVVGHTPADSAAKPDTSLSAQMEGDEIPF
jgi:hypothetical protein